MDDSPKFNSILRFLQSPDNRKSASSVIDFVDEVSRAMRQKGITEFAIGEIKIKISPETESDVIPDTEESMPDRSAGRPLSGSNQEFRDFLAVESWDNDPNDIDPPDEEFLTAEKEPVEETKSDGEEK